MIKSPESNLKFEKTTNKKTSLQTMKPIEPKEDELFRCCACGHKYKDQSKNFPFSQSAFFNGNNSRLPICNNCFNSATDKYEELLGGSDEAVKRMCLHWDIYLSENTLMSSKKIDASRSRIKEYVRQCNLNQNSGKTYDTFLEEQYNMNITSIEEIKDKSTKVQQKTVKFFGFGFTEDEYQQMSSQYDDWIGRHECKTKAQEELFKNICIIQVQIQKATKKGEKVDALMKTYQDLLGSANLKPTQTNENTLADQNTFGTLIQKWENEKPISEPNPEWKDVDGIRKYINVWFLGHLCKMMGIKNTYSQEYEDEIARYKVEKPEYIDEDENDNPALNDMFNEGM